MFACRACAQRFCSALLFGPSTVQRPLRLQDTARQLSAAPSLVTDELVTNRPARSPGDRVSISRRRKSVNVQKGSVNESSKDNGDGQKSGRAKARPNRPLNNSKLAQVANNAALIAKGERRKTAAALKRELDYLQDPLKLAGHVKQLLETRQETDKALALVRLANTSKTYVVSWNHIIDWLLKNGQVRRAFATYNEMKKRNQRPDHYTYTILLRGLAQNVKTPSSLGRALALYHSIRQPKSKIKPSHYHTNSVLTVCSHALDLDSIWDILSQLPERGPLAPNALTFTIIFNTLRHHSTTPPNGGEKASQATVRREQAIVDGRRMWPTIIQRWSQGELEIDATMVNAMGRLLLVGQRPRDWDDVLSLMHQTMNIPRLVPKLSSGIAAQGARFSEITQGSSNGVDPKSTSEIIETKAADLAGQEFDVFASQSSAQTALSGAYEDFKGPRATFRGSARPVQSTISLAMEACLKLGKAAVAVDYFRLLTDRDGYNLEPDQDNMNIVLRNYRQARQSNEAVELIEEMDKRFQLKPSTKTLRIAMAACEKDEDASQALKSANKVLDLVFAMNLKWPELMVLRQYLEVVLRSDSVETMFRAIKRLNPEVVNMRSLVGIKGDKEGNAVEDDQPTPDNETRQEAVQFLATLRKTYDRVLEIGQEQTTGRAHPAELRRRRERINAYIERINAETGKEREALREAVDEMAEQKSKGAVAREEQQQSREWSLKRRERDLANIRALEETRDN